MTSSKKLKIAFVIDTTLDVEDGVQQYILVLGDWLREQGHDVHYIVGETHRTDVKNLHSMTKNIKVHFNGNKVVVPLPASTKKIKKILNTEKFDVLHVQVPYSPFFASKVVKHAHKETVVVGTFHILPFGKIAYIGTWVLGLILRSNLKRFDLQISVSEANKEFSANTFKTKSIVIPNMVKVSEFKPNKASFKKGNVKLLYLGRLTKRKGALLLLEAVKKLVEDHPDIHFELDIAGRGELYGELKKRIERYNLSEKIKLLGFVSNSKRTSLMQNANIAVFPSYSGECFGIVLIEAMASQSGMVIGGNNPGYASVLGTVPECLVDVHDTDTFSKLLYKSISDANFRKEIFNKQQKLIDQYDYNVVGKRILEKYNECINAKINNSILKKV